jgi:hypothetical protein
MTVGETHVAGARKIQALRLPPRRARRQVDVVQVWAQTLRCSELSSCRPVLLQHVAARRASLGCGNLYSTYSTSRMDEPRHKVVVEEEEEEEKLLLPRGASKLFRQLGGGVISTPPPPPPPL